MPKNKTNTISFPLFFECECGEEVNVAFEEANHLIKIDPCENCMARAVNEYKETVREKLLQTVENV